MIFYVSLFANGIICRVDDNFSDQHLNELLHLVNFYLIILIYSEIL
jgi:hypothetical protein